MKLRLWPRREPPTPVVEEEPPPPESDPEAVAHEAPPAVEPEPIEEPGGEAPAPAKVALTIDEAKDTIREAGGDVIGVDWRVDLATAWAAVGHDVAVQGNLEPAVLLAAPAYIRKRAKAVLDAAGGRAGHIFNLGHGIHKETPVEHVKALVDIVHELSDRR